MTDSINHLGFVLSNRVESLCDKKHIAFCLNLQPSVKMQPVNKLCI